MLQVFDFTDSRILLGAAAFILTAFNLVLGFPLLLRAGVTTHSRWWFLLLLGSLLMHLVWLGYLWFLQDYFVRAGLCLQVAGSAILVGNNLWYRKNNGPGP
jgi:peptidoglycan biosynthesis protein MviN/MurJ (putative lipid II flippase)